MAAFPQQQIPNGYQIFGQALAQGGAQVQDFANQQDKIRLAMEEMAARRAEGVLAKIKADREERMAQEESARRAAEEQRKATEFATKQTQAQKSAAARSEIAAGKTVPGKSVGGVIQPDETMPYGYEEASRILLGSGDLSGKEFAELSNPAKTIEGQKEIFGFKDAAQATREERRQAFQAAQEAFRQGRMDERAFAAIKASFEKGEIAKEGKRFDQEQKLLDKFLTQTKDYRDVRDAYGRIQVSARNPSPAGDLALIFNYMKMLDPGSTVRESEFASAAASGSYGDRLQAAASKLVNGERLSPDQRQDFLDRAKSLYTQQATQAKKTEAETKKQARSYGLNESRAVTDIGIADEKDPLGLGL